MTHIVIAAHAGHDLVGIVDNEAAEEHRPEEGACVPCMTQSEYAVRKRERGQESDKRRRRGGEEERRRGGEISKQR